VRIRTKPPWAATPSAMANRSLPGKEHRAATRQPGRWSHSRWGFHVAVFQSVTRRNAPEASHRPSMAPCQRLHPRRVLQLPIGRAQESSSPSRHESQSSPPAPPRGARRPATGASANTGCTRREREKRDGGDGGLFRQDAASPTLSPLLIQARIVFDWAP
jgi:hypothetical protein